MKSIFRSTIREWFIGGMVWTATLLGLQAEDWPQWRGLDRSNATRETGFLNEWPAEGPPLVWRATGIGLGIHSVSVAGGRVYVIGNRDGGEFVFALDARTGEKVWATRVDSAIEEQQLMRWLTQRCPTVDGDLLYTFSARGTLECLRSADGQKVWQKSYPKEFGVGKPVWGFCDHPLVDGERLICSPFSTNAALVALNKHTGQVVWQRPFPEPIRAGYAALIRSSAANLPQFVVFHGSGLAGFAADDGRLLWRYARPNTRTGSTYTPIARGDTVLSPNGYNGGLVSIRIVRRENELTAETVDQQNFSLDPFQDASVVVEDRVYLFERSTTVCVGVTNGARIWGNGSAHPTMRTALTWAEGHLYLRNARGEMTLLEVLPEGVLEKGRFQIPEHEASLGVTFPVVANGRLWLRDNNRLFCYDISRDAHAATETPVPHRAIGLTDRELEVDPQAVESPKSGVNRGPDAVYVPTPHDVVERMLQEANPKRHEVFVALGSGDGRYVIAAAKKFGCKAIGYEIDPRLVELSREAIAKENLGALARIEHQDLFTADLSGADVIAVFLYPRLMERLIPQFATLKPGARILSHQFEMPGVRPDRTWMVYSKEDGDRHRALLWIAPIKRD